MINIKPKVSSDKKIEKILIVTEDTKSALRYLRDKVKDLGLSSKCSVSELSVKTEVFITSGKGSTPDQVVQTAIKIKEEKDKVAKRSKSYTYTRIYCVMDVDDHTTLGDALERLRQLNRDQELYIPIVSNECFELWYVLHHLYTTGALYRATKNEAKSNPSNNLSKIIERKFEITDYDKGHTQMFLLTKQLESTAIKNAEKLEKFHKENNTKGRFGVNANPSTDVHHLIKFLNSMASDGAEQIIPQVPPEIILRYSTQYSSQIITDLWVRLCSICKAKSLSEKELLLIDILENTWSSTFVCCNFEISEILASRQ